MEATPFRKTVGAVAIIEDHQSVKIMFVMGMLPDELIQVRIYFVRLGIRQSKQQEDAALTPVPDRSIPAAVFPCVSTTTLMLTKAIPGKRKLKESGSECSNRVGLCWAVSLYGLRLG